jgi:hypothetical protein
LALQGAPLGAGDGARDRVGGTAHPWRRGAVDDQHWHVDLAEALHRDAKVAHDRCVVDERLGAALHCLPERRLAHSRDELGRHADRSGEEQLDGVAAAGPGHGCNKLVFVVRRGTRPARLAVEPVGRFPERQLRGAEPAGDRLESDDGTARRAVQERSVARCDRILLDHWVCLPAPTRHRQNWTV